MVTEYVYTGVSIFGEQFLAYLAPYFLARVLFHSPEMRRRALWICVVCSFIIAFFTLIEIRLWPYFLSRCLKTFGLFTGSNGQVLYRFGFMRAQTTFDHPIDMGNSCLLMAAMIAVLAMTTSVGIKISYVRLALAAALCCSFSSLSFTSWVGSFAAIGCFMTLWMLSFTRKIVILFVFGLFCGFAAMTYHLYNVDVDARRDQDEQEIGQTAQDSMFVRAMIIQNCWPFAQTTGLFGWGNTIRHSQLALESVDNSYMLFTMRRGFVFLSMFLMIPVIMALRAMRAFQTRQIPGPMDAAGDWRLSGAGDHGGDVYGLVWVRVFGAVGNDGGDDDVDVRRAAHRPAGGAAARQPNPRCASPATAGRWPWQGERKCRAKPS